MSECDADRPSADEPELSAAEDHLENLPDGAGCTDIWEHLSGQREAAEE